MPQHVSEDEMRVAYFSRR